MKFHAHNLSKRIFGSVLSIIALLGIASTAFAQQEAETISSQSSFMVLSGDNNFNSFEGVDSDSFLGKSEIWSDNWGVSANVIQNNNQDVFGLPKDSEYFNLDVKRRFGSQDKSNFELGLGWQELNIDSAIEASGPKVSLGGKLNLKWSVQLYGSTSYFPELEDQIKNTDATAYEIEAGLLYKPLPSLSLKAGYRHFSFDAQDPIVDELGSSSGFLLGTDVSW